MAPVINRVEKEGQYMESPGKFFSGPLTSLPVPIQLKHNKSWRPNRATSIYSSWQIGYWPDKHFQATIAMCWPIKIMSMAQKTWIKLFVQLGYCRIVDGPFYVSIYSLLIGLVPLKCMGWPLEIGESCGIGYWAIVQQITKLGSIDYGSWFLGLNLDRKRRSWDWKMDYCCRSNYLCTLAIVLLDLDPFDHKTCHFKVGPNKAVRKNGT